MEVVMGAVKIGRHYRLVVAAILPTVAFANLNACDLGNRIGLVRGLKNAGQKCIFAHRLHMIISQSPAASS